MRTPCRRAPCCSPPPSLPLLLPPVPEPVREAQCPRRRPEEPRRPVALRAARAEQAPELEPGPARSGVRPARRQVMWHLRLRPRPVLSLEPAQRAERAGPRMGAASRRRPRARCSSASVGGQVSPLPPPPPPPQQQPLRRADQRAPLKSPPPPRPRQAERGRSGAAAG